MAFRSDCARRNRQFAAEKHRVRNPPDMPQLQEDAPAAFVNGARDLLPALNLLAGPNTGRCRVAAPIGVTDVASEIMRPALARWA